MLLAPRVLAVSFLAVVLVACGSPSQEPTGSQSQYQQTAANGAAEEPLGLYENLDKMNRLRPPVPSTAVNEIVPFYVFRLASRWPITPSRGAIVSVCFAGGSNELKARILAIADEWSKIGNVTFDAGAAPAFRVCQSNTSANIRIGYLTGDDGGYWSVVGNTPTAEAITMNYQGFDTAPPSPVEFRTTVLHEFGHALGFEHEHQHPYGRCDAEFDWPTVYAAFGAPPNKWPREKVDFNLRALPPSSAYGLSSPDRKSIMHYTFLPWMFKTGTNSPCYVQPTTELSALDKEGASSFYPRVYTTMTARGEAEGLEKLAAALPSGAVDAKKYVNSVAAQIRTAR